MNKSGFISLLLILSLAVVTALVVGSGIKDEVRLVSHDRYGSDKMLDSPLEDLLLPPLALQDLDFPYSPDTGLRDLGNYPVEKANWMALVAEKLQIEFQVGPPLYSCGNTECSLDPDEYRSFFLEVGRGQEFWDEYCLMYGGGPICH